MNKYTLAWDKEGRYTPTDMECCVCFWQTFGVCSFVIWLPAFAFRFAFALAKLELNQTIAAGHLPLIKPFNFNHRHSMQSISQFANQTKPNQLNNTRQHNNGGRKRQEAGLMGKQTNSMAKYLPWTNLPQSAALLTHFVWRLLVIQFGIWLN